MTALELLENLKRLAKTREQSAAVICNEFGEFELLLIQHYSDIDDVTIKETTNPLALLGAFPETVVHKSFPAPGLVTIETQTGSASWGPLNEIEEAPLSPKSCKCCKRGGQLSDFANPIKCAKKCHCHD